MRTITVDEANHHPSSLTNLGVRLGGGVPAVVITRLDPSLPETVVEGGWQGGRRGSQRVV